jgi:hypothetical protein
MFILFLHLHCSGLEPHRPANLILLFLGKAKELNSFQTFQQPQDRNENLPVPSFLPTQGFPTQPATLVKRENPQIPSAYSQSPQDLVRRCRVFAKEKELDVRQIREVFLADAVYKRVGLAPLRRSRTCFVRI